MLLPILANPLSGPDLLSHFRLLVDCANRTITDTVTAKSVVGLQGCAEINITQLYINQLDDSLGPAQNIFSRFPKLVTPKLGPTTFQNKVNHFIETHDAPPVFWKHRQLPPDKFAAAQHEFKSLLEKGIIRPSKSPWSSPLHLVPKKNPAEWRLYGDYHNLNNVTKPDRYPITHIHDISGKFQGMSNFSKID